MNSKRKIMQSIKILDVIAKDIRFPTSQELHGSDAMNPDPDYSAAYVILETDADGLEGHGMTFTIGLLGREPVGPSAREQIREGLKAQQGAVEYLEVPIEL